MTKVHMQPLPLQHHEVFIEEVPEGEGTPPELYRGLSRTDIADLVRACGAPLLNGSDVTRKGVMGTPTPFLDVMVIDEHAEPCPVGQPGQLAVRPKLPSLILTEYVGKPVATVSAWRNLWFHTGDAAVLQPDGMFDFVDRLGDRIRVRGENLSSFQVEDLLIQHERVQMVAAFAIKGSEGDEDDIVVFAVPIEGTALSEEELHAYAAASMPRYMRPRFFRVVSDIPRTPTNKVEKYKLRARMLEEISEAGSRS